MSKSCFYDFNVNMDVFVVRSLLLLCVFLSHHLAFEEVCVTGLTGIAVLESLFFMRMWSVCLICVLFFLKID